MFVASYYARPLPKDEFKIVAKACNENASDIMIAEYSSLAPLFSEVTEPTVKSVLLHDLMAARTEEYKRLGKEPDFLPVTLQQEAEWMSDATLLICASVNEEETLRNEMDNIDTVWLCPDSPSYEVEFKLETPRIVFIGTRHFGNTDAINHFIEEIFPLIKEKLPDVECWIVGSTGADVLPENQSVEGIKLLGRVQDLPDIGGVSSVGIAPTRLASGISIKVAEYLALGMTCVAYRKALEGFGAVLDQMTEIAEDPRDFAERTVKLLNDVDARTSQFKTAPDEIRKINHNRAVQDALLKPF
ncbi:MAG: glycosyltransferase family 4 protein [Pseudomonadota bacterium]